MNARREKGLKAKELAAILGISPAYLSGLENSRELKPDILKRIEAALGTLPDDPDYIRENATESSVPRKPSSLKHIKTVGNALVPLYRNVVKAGSGGSVLEDETDEFDIAVHYDGTAIYEVSGDSMIDASIEEGDRVVVKLGHAFKPKSIILMRYKGELQLKGAAIVDGVIMCFPANPHYHEWACAESDEFQCIGTVIEIIKKPHTEWWKRWDLRTLKKKDKE